MSLSLSLRLLELGDICKGGENDVVCVGFF